MGAGLFMLHGMVKLVMQEEFCALLMMYTTVGCAENLKKWLFDLPDCNYIKY